MPCDLPLRLPSLHPGAVQELCEFAELKVLYLHGNNITKLHEVEKLSKLGLRTLTERVVAFFSRSAWPVSIQSNYQRCR